MDIRDVEKRIFECPKHRVGVCPVAKKFKEVNGELPIPEAYLGNPKAKFMIIGINPGASKNYLNPNFEKYQNQIRKGISEQFWQYHYVTEIFGYPPLKDGGGMVTNLIHCPTQSWTKPKEEKWVLNDAEKQKSIELCSPFLFEIIGIGNPKLILLHGLDTVKFFTNYCGWNINQDIQGLIKTCHGRTFVLSRHLASIRDEKGRGAWKALEDAAKTL